MDFPAYVPVPVREYITKSNAQLDEALADTQRRLDEIEQAAGAKDGIPDDLRWEQRKTADHKKRLERLRNCLHRLVDVSMRDAFALLTLEFGDDDAQYVGFIRAAWEADLDYQQIRESLRKARELQADIAKKAKELAALLRKYKATGISEPDAFTSIPALVRLTPDGGRLLALFSKGRAGAIGSALERHPPLSSALDSLAELATHFLPLPAPFATWGTALNRQHNPRTAYIRAFAVLLSQYGAYPSTCDGVKAMAVAADAVLGDGVSYADVAYAISWKNTKTN